VLALGSFPAVGTNLLALLNGQEPSTIQRSALEALAGFSEVAVAQGLVERWRGLAPTVRPPAINLLLQRVPFHDVLLTAIEQGQLQMGELTLDLEQRGASCAKHAGDSRSCRQVDGR